MRVRANLAIMTSKNKSDDGSNLFLFSYIHIVCTSGICKSNGVVDKICKVELSTIVA